MIGLLAIVCCALPLDTVIEALLATRILVQFIAQAVAVILLRRRAPKLERPYRVWLYPLPNLLAIVGWTFVFGTSDPKVIALALAMLMLGGLAFLVRAWWSDTWPFASRR